MNTKTLLTALAALSWSTAAFADAGHGDGVERAFGEPGDPKKPARIVQIVMRETSDNMEFVPKRIEIRNGEQVKFILRNNGELDHEFVLGTLAENLKHAEQMQKNPDMEHDDPNAKRLPSKKTSEIVWKFDKAGEFDFSCLIPGHRDAGMSGTIVVK
ncbi:MAG: copper resistance protein [Hyphomicrobiales bacterium]|nr:MAG: copper resistance protein [Hyphomicrobiales bacterium]